MLLEFLCSAFRDSDTQQPGKQERKEGVEGSRPERAEGPTTGRKSRKGGIGENEKEGRRDATE